MGRHNNHNHNGTAALNGAVAVAVAVDANRIPDAGMRHGDHYANRLPSWRYTLRQTLIPIVRAETPYLALLQEKCRTPALDTYFAFTANLGTHTFFMTALPILFWCGYTELGRALVHILAAGVFWSGFLKDMLCLPRPLSPPLQRITMSGSAALEYGWPSTHSTNAVSVAAYALWLLYQNDEPSNPTLNLGLKITCYVYAVSIVLGRLYCGMHGFFDVIIGSVLGLAIAFAQAMYGASFDAWVTAGPYTRPLLVTLAVLLAVRVHPEPADDCPCFDDSVAFAGVVIGINIGGWHYAGIGWDDPVPATVPFDLEKLGWSKTVARIATGVIVIFLWRATMKSLLLKVLPPIFRFVDHLGLILPRKFFLPSSQYTTVPPLQHDDRVIPSASEIPSLLSRTRSVSIGPQSAADAYETLAYRQKRRRESLENPLSPVSETKKEKDYFHTSQTHKHQKSLSDSHMEISISGPPGIKSLPTPMASRVHSYEEIMGTDADDIDIAIESPITPPSSDTEPFPAFDHDVAADEEEDRKIFLKLQRPRVRYDVEVVTKLIVYSGIAWLAVEGNPRVFGGLGLEL